MGRNRRLNTNIVLEDERTLSSGQWNNSMVCCHTEAVIRIIDTRVIVVYSRFSPPLPRFWGSGGTTDDHVSSHQELLRETVSVGESRSAASNQLHLET